MKIEYGISITIDPSMSVATLCSEVYLPKDYWKRLLPRPGDRYRMNVDLISPNQEYGGPEAGRHTLFDLCNYNDYKFLKPGEFFTLTKFFGKFLPDISKYILVIPGFVYGMPARQLGHTKYVGSPYSVLPLDACNYIPAGMRVLAAMTPMTLVDKDEWGTALGSEYFVSKE